MNFLKCLLAGALFCPAALAQPQATGTARPAQNEVFQNAAPNFQQRAASLVQQFKFDLFSPIQTIGHYNLYQFNAPGFNWGNAGGWSVQLGTSEKANFNTRGIAQVYVSESEKHATGDFAAQYIYAHTDGGATAQSDEGFTLDTRQGGESNAWFQGTAGAGAAPGTTLLPVNYVAGPHSQRTTTDGAFMLDITKGTISGVVTGPEALVEGTSVHIMPVSVKLPPSTGIGIVETVIPRIEKADVPETITLANVHLIHGSFVTGKACLAGGWYPEQVLVTKAAPARNGSQDVTLIHKNPNGRDANNPTSLWQGGVCGQYLSLDRNMARDGFRTSYEVVGATDASHLAYIWNVKGNTKQHVLRIYQPPVLLKNLSRSKGIVTASFSGANQPFIFNHAANIVIADASNPSFNGAVHLPEYDDDLNRTLKWSQAGPDESAATATINLPPSYDGFHLYPGAEVLGPQAGGSVPLEPNSVEWAPGDVIENPHSPSFFMYGRMTLLTQNTLSSGYNSDGEVWRFSGSGISANYFPSTWENENPCSLYVGCGGTLDPIRWKTYTGPYRELINVRNAPLNRGPFITIGCDLRGCDHPAPYRLFELQHGTMDYDPANGTFTVPRMAANLFSGNLDGLRVATTQIELRDPRSPDQTLLIANSGGKIVIHAGTTSGTPVPSGMERDDTAASMGATVVVGPSNRGGRVMCASGYTCTAMRGRLTLIAAAGSTVGTVASVKAMLPAKAICTVTQNGGSRFFGIGSGKESPTGFDITASLTLLGELTVDYSCR